MERNPHLLFEGCLIACHAIGAKVAYIYIRGEFFHVQQVLERQLEEAYAQGLRRQERDGPRVRLRHPHPPRRRRLRSGRRDRAARVARGQARAAAAEAAVSGERRAVRLRRRRSTTSRRSATCRSILRNGAEWYAALGPEKNGGPEALLHQRPRGAAGRLRSVDEDHAARADLRRRGRRPRRPRAQGGDPRRLVGADSPARSARHRGQLRRRGESRVAARLGRHHRARRHDVHGVAGREPAAVLSPRVVRQVHAVPRRHAVAAQHPARRSSAAKAR